MPGAHRAKLVVMGGEAVGKTSIVRRFLFDTFQHRHQPTVEELYSRDFSLSPRLTLGVDFLDTSGSLQFPAMRRHAILSAHAFLLVYTLGCPASLATARALLREISELRGGLQGLPVLMAGNKADLQRGRAFKAARHRDWLEQEHPGVRVPLVECSAKDNINIQALYANLLKESGLPRLLTALSLPPAPSSGLSGARLAATRTYSFPLGAFPSKDAEGEKEAKLQEAKLALCLEPKAKPRSKSLVWRKKNRRTQSVKQEDCTVS